MSADPTPGGKRSKFSATQSHRVLISFCHRHFYQWLTEGPTNNVAQALCKSLLSSNFPVLGATISRITGKNERTVWHAAQELNKFLAEFSAEEEPFKSTETKLVIPRYPKGGIHFGYYFACFSNQENRYLNLQEIQQLFRDFDDRTKVMSNGRLKAVDEVQSRARTETGPFYDYNTLFDGSMALIKTYSGDAGRGKTAWDGWDHPKVAASITAPGNIKFAGRILSNFLEADRTVAWQVCEGMNKEKLADHLITVLESVPLSGDRHALFDLWWTIDLVYRANPLAAKQLWDIMDKEKVGSILRAAGVHVSWGDIESLLIHDGYFLSFSWGSLLGRGLSWVDYDDYDTG